MSVVSLFLIEALILPLIQAKACKLSNFNGFTVFVFVFFVFYISVVSLFLTEAQRPPLIQEKACALSNSNGFTVLVPGTNSRCLTIMASATCVDEINLRHEIEVTLSSRSAKRIPRQARGP